MKKTSPLRAHLFLNTLVILLVGMGLAAFLAWRAVEILYLDTQRENLLAQANLTAAALQGQTLPAASDQPYLQTSNTLPGIHTHLFADQGAVLVNLPMQPGEILAPPAENSVPLSPEDLLGRSEIIQAMQGKAASAVRAVSSRPILYAAAPIWAADGSVSGLVYLAMPLPASGLPFNLLLAWIAAALLAVITALIAGTLLSRRIIAPIEDISRAASAVSAGDLNQQVPTSSDIRELHALGLAFNAMTENLLKSEQAQNAFVADVAHELRTPMTVIKGTIETLEDGALDDLSGRGPLLASMQRETDRLIRLVNDLLVLTRAAGTLNLAIEPLDLVDLARSRCEQLAALAARRQVCLQVSGADSAWVMGDSDRLSQALDNLLDNAIRYSSAGSGVTVEICPHESEVRCSVRDHGTGIPEKQLAHIFERFYRADVSRNRQTGGAGLGLTIVQALIWPRAAASALKVRRVLEPALPFHCQLPVH